MKTPVLVAAAFAGLIAGAALAPAQAMPVAHEGQADALVSTVRWDHHHRHHWRRHWGWEHRHHGWERGHHYGWRHHSRPHHGHWR